MSFLKKSNWLMLLVIGSIGLLTACNKELPDATPIERPPDGVSPTLYDLLSDTSFSILKAAVDKAGLNGALSDVTARYTVFAPNNTAMRASGVTEGLIAALPVEQVAAIISYHVMPQLLTSANIPTTFPNFEYPSILNPAPTVSPFLRLSAFPSKRGNIAWANNIPIVAPDITAVNGVAHVVARVVAPPSADLWSRINTDPALTYLKASIERADSGAAPGKRLLDALSLAANPSSIGSNLTIFAPTDNAFKAFLGGAITKALLSLVPLPQTMADTLKAAGTASFLVATYGTTILTDPYSISPLLGAVITPTLAKGIVVYHILSKQTTNYAPPGIRVFSVNLPTTATPVKTLLNSAVAGHPGLLVSATFDPSGYGVIAATVKGAANATASNVLINPFPGGSSDQNYINGIIHKIDQVLLPQ